jgi:hypothetical protein
LQLTHKVPGEVDVDKFLVLCHSFLMTVFPDILDARLGKLTDKRRGMKLGHHDGGDFLGGTPCLAGSRRDLFLQSMPS